MEITVKEINGNTTRLTVDLSATVGDLKQKISQHFNVQTSQQKLSVNNGQRHNLDDDSRNLSFYGVSSGSTIALLITNPVPIKQVFVKNEKGQTSTYDVDVDETVDQLREKIYNKQRVPLDQWSLVCDGKELKSGMKLKDYGIKDKSTMHMTLRLRGG
ncbi:uncharacterized protein [Paramisgurnus dabryanus]|uniref:uncharacterized protein n=1 Tax=Paramisgurnus dabryanus TaxID=90735 RepID=UPI003CCF7564